MCDSTHGVHLLVLVTFVSIIGDIVKQFTKRFHDKNFKTNNPGNIVEKDVDDVVTNMDKLNNEGVEIELISKYDKTKTKGGDGKVDDGSKIGSNYAENEDSNNSSNNDVEQMVDNGQIDMNVAIGGIKNFILLIIDNMLPHFIFGKIYKRYNGFFMDQEKNLPPLLWIDFLPQEKECAGLASLSRFISFAIARTALNLIYCIAYPLIYGVEYKPNALGP